LPEVPDFTKTSWQARRSDAQLLASILDGKEPDMPSWQGKISEEQARTLVDQVRAFAPNPRTPKAASTADFSERFHRLQEQLNDLQSQERNLSKDSRGGSAPSKPPQPPQPEASWRPPAKGAGSPAARELFRRRCDKCHGADGTGSRGRDRLPEIPDFTDASWQARRSDEQLLESILDGKDEMPAWRGKISAEQARSLVACVRAFVPTTGKSGPIQQEGRARPNPTRPNH
jgi:mono/diheme cytochrome c family protein